MTLRLEVVDDLRPHADAWDRLVDADGANPFLRSWWLLATATGRPRIAVVLDGAETIVGGLALERVIRVVPQLRMIGEELGAADLDLLAEPDHVAGVVELLGGWLRDVRGPTRFRLGGLTQGARVASIVPAATVATEGVALWEPTPDSLEDYLASRSRNLRKDLARTRRRLLDEHGASIRVVPAAEAPKALNRFHELHARQMGEGSVLSPQRVTFDRAILAGVAAGEVHLHAVEHAGTFVAVEVMLTHGPRLGLLASAHDSTRPELSGAGNLLSLHAFEHAIERGFAEVDFLRGASEYKHRWVSQSRPVLTATGNSGTLARAAGDLPAAAKRALRGARRRGAP